MDQLDLDRELDALYAAISGRRFSYDPYSDPLYRSYAARYVQNGRMAMRDTMGQAAALTGGYASSYGQAVGQQQYDEYLRALSEAMPELYQMAYQRYSAEGEALRGAYDMANARRESDYARERDAAADAAARDERDYKRRQDAYAQERPARRLRRALLRQTPLLLRQVRLPGRRRKLRGQLRGQRPRPQQAHALEHAHVSGVDRGGAWWYTNRKALSIFDFSRFSRRCRGNRKT